MKLRHVVMMIGLIASGGLVLFGDKTPANHVVDAVSHSASQQAASATSSPTLLSTLNSSAATTKVSAQSGQHSEPTILNLRPRKTSTQAAGVESNLFGLQSWTPPPAPPPPPPPPPPPAAPAMPFTYIGKRLVEGNWEVFLGRGDTISYVHVGMVVDTNYRIESIAPPLLKITYLPLNQQQTLAIGEPE